MLHNASSGGTRRCFSHLPQAPFVFRHPDWDVGTHRSQIALALVAVVVCVQDGIHLAHADRIQIVEHKTAAKISAQHGHPARWRIRCRYLGIDRGEPESAARDSYSYATSEGCELIIRYTN